MKVLQAVSSPWRAAQQQPSPKEAHPITRRGVEQLPMGKRGGGEGGAGELPGPSVMFSVQCWGGVPQGLSATTPKVGPRAVDLTPNTWI